jgi:3-hydroxyisobutyrate dehydrogenase
MKPGAVWIQMSTIGVEGTERAWRLAGTRPEIGFLDAPVSGSKAAAEQGKLVILGSGDQGRVGATAQPLFDAIAVKTHWLGHVGQGTRMKLLLNAWIAALMEGSRKCLYLAMHSGSTWAISRHWSQADPWFRRGQSLNCRR